MQSAGEMCALGHQTSEDTCQKRHSTTDRQVMTPLLANLDVPFQIRLLAGCI